MNRTQALAHSLKLQSTAFEPNGEIPMRHTGEGDDISPPLLWSGAPAGTQEFALICEDPDAPSPEPWIHWVAYHIPARITHLPEGIHRQDKLDIPIKITQGVNSFKKIGFNGPMPPQGHGWHRYFFHIYALDLQLQLSPRATQKDLLKAIKGHILAETHTMGRYRRN
jgi:Raf kinase inhibitor-like YbhB/YbcL family protein